MSSEHRTTGRISGMHTVAVSLHADLSGAGADVVELLNWPGVPPMFAFRDQDGNELKSVQS